MYPDLYVLRHGETVWNSQNRMQGDLNSPLTAKGEGQAVRQGEILAGRDLDGFLFLSSPQARAVQTAGIALAGVAHMIETDRRLREIGVGDWSGMLRSELPMPEGDDPMLAQYEIAPNGEGSAKLEVRCREFLADLKQPAVLVTHGVTSRMLRLIVVGKDGLGLSDIHGGQGCVYHLSNGSQNLLI